MRSLSCAGALVGLGLGCGLWVAFVRSPVLRRVRLDDRIEPYLRDLMSRSPNVNRLAPALTPFPVVERLLRPVLADAAATLERAAGGAVSVRRRLERAGRVPDSAAFRAEQVVWGVALMAAAAASAGALWSRGSLSPTGAAALVLLAGLVGVLGRDRALSRLARRREERMLTEFPTVAELLALAVSAGEGPVAALERVCRASSGDLSAELRRCLGEARAGASLPAALHGLGARTGLASLSRFVDGVVVAVERGTPLGEVLRAQAGDVREASRRALMESGGRKEVAMMLPVVFLVLPVTVLFAVYPGVAYLSFQV